MHFLMICLALTVALGIRLIPMPTEGDWQERWQRSLFLFLFPPLILITTVLSVLLMGASGEMMGLKASGFSYWLSIGFIFFLGFNLIQAIHRALLSSRKVVTYSQKLVRDRQAYLIDLELPYIAQIGLWQPKLVISQGLINLLDDSQLEAVLAHEQAHLHYGDTVSFFWLGWLKKSTFWLYNTESLWQELLLLREIRADLEAAKTVDSLTLAESLLAVAQAPLQAPFSLAVGFSLPLPDNRLAQRIDALINDAALPSSPNLIYWSWLLLLLIPWATVPFHC